MRTPMYCCQSDVIICAYRVGGWVGGFEILKLCVRNYKWMAPVNNSTWDRWFISCVFIWRVSARSIFVTSFVVTAWFLYRPTADNNRWVIAMCVSTGNFQQKNGAETPTKHCRCKRIFCSVYGDLAHWVIHFHVFIFRHITEDSFNWDAYDKALPQVFNILSTPRESHFATLSSMCQFLLTVP